MSIAKYQQGQRFYSKAKPIRHITLLKEYEICGKVYYKYSHDDLSTESFGRIVVYSEDWEFCFRFSLIDT